MVGIGAVYLNPRQLADDIAARICRDWLQLEQHTSATQPAPVRAIVLDVLQGFPGGGQRMRIVGDLENIVPRLTDPGDVSTPPGDKPPEVH